ncbi:MAG TPA: glycosyltransferase, partial [Steroidobacteraceae bacterium]|nr:glycosyltransferase [Steroidobacteraceae bacterium]
MIVLAALSVLIWVYLFAARGGFWRVRPAPAPPEAVRAVRVVAVVPARNEADVIGDSVASLLLQRLHGSLRVIVVDDASTDGTAAAAQSAARALGAQDRLTLIRGSGPPPLWSGKVAAMARGVEAAAQFQPDYLLFTD